MGSEAALMRPISVMNFNGNESGADYGSDLSFRMHLSILQLKALLFSFSLFTARSARSEYCGIVLTSASKIVQSSHLISFTIQYRIANLTATTTMVRPTRTWLAALMPAPWLISQIAGDAGGDGSMTSTT